MSKLDIFQTALCLSIIADAVNDLQGKTPTELQTTAEKEIGSRILQNLPEWEVVWGPVVYADPGDDEGAPDNVWYIVHNPKAIFPGGQEEDTYMVAIAGSASHSGFDRSIEAFVVQTVVDFNAWVAQGLHGLPEEADDVNDEANSYISTGVAIGLSALVNTAVPEDGDAKAPNTTLFEFLGTLPATAKVIFTGHGLGASLASVLAVGWSKVDVAKEVPQANVFTYPIASSSAWNLNFVKLYESIFPVPAEKDSPGYKRFNTNVINKLDVLPLAWCTKPDLEPELNLTRVPTFNEATGMESFYISAVVEAYMIPTANKSGIVYRPLKYSSFTAKGTPPFPKPDDGTPEEGKPFLPQWNADAAYQHIVAYIEEFGVLDYLKKSEPK